MALVGPPGVGKTMLAERLPGLLPDLDDETAVEATRRIVGAHPGIRVVLLSTYDLADLPHDARTSGAIAYVNKDDFGTRVLRRLWERGIGDGFDETGS